MRSGVYPACAGIDLRSRLKSRLRSRLPRMRGDRPRKKDIPSFQGKFTPHARGSTDLSFFFLLFGFVYPACAGIDLHGHGTFPSQPSLPRMRGDRPAGREGITGIVGFTPHARGSTLTALVGNRLFPVYPACAGIDLMPVMVLSPSLSLPRMRGDRPSISSSSDSVKWFTPHARGSTPGYTEHIRKHTVYPACAGIDRDTRHP